MYRTHFHKLTVLSGSEIIVGRDKHNCHKLTDLDGRRNQFIAVGTNLVKHSKAVRATKVRLAKFIGLNLENLRWKIFRFFSTAYCFLDCQIFKPRLFKSRPGKAKNFGRTGPAIAPWQRSQLWQDWKSWQPSCLSWQHAQCRTNESFFLRYVITGLILVSVFSHNFFK